MLHTPVRDTNPGKDTQLTKDVEEEKAIRGRTEMGEPSTTGMQITGGIQENAAADFRHVRLPPFWRNRPRLWFVQLESEFSNYGMRSDDRRCHAIIRHLDEGTMTAVSDVLENPPDADKYDTLKNTLINRFSDSQEKQLRILLSTLELGDRKPSQLLREMRSLAGDNATEGLLRTLWLQRLPTRIQELLLILEDTTLVKLAECADKLHEHPSTMENKSAQYVSVADSTAPMAMNEQIRRLTEHVAALSTKLGQTHRHGRNRFRSRSRSRYSRSRNRTPTPADGSQDGQCYYHQRFGNKAYKSGAVNERPKRSPRLHISDKATGWIFLIDTGADVSIIPVTYLRRRPPLATSSLYAVNGNKIKTYGERKLTLQLGLRRPIKGDFVIADVTRPVIGADILTDHGLIVDLQGKRLIDKLTGLSTRGFRRDTEHVTTITLDLDMPYHRILAEFPQLTSRSRDDKLKAHGRYQPQLYRISTSRVCVAPGPVP
ncbi:hypothetical protein KPH14_012762 [Odynerus spinipes]|uniref:Peptidase A2 domain-containing protein n=1 Tax=Odynerus spinipes TaxID=1348599 RepID=A0AAD9R8V4_9HYME|nr:hypothetical protein KPH14_012762 [Odynerus spinipes]